VDVVHYATDLLQVEERLVSQRPLSQIDALSRQREGLCNQLLLILPALRTWSRDTKGGLPAYTTTLLRG
jgi:hypothetical protein